MFRIISKRVFWQFTKFCLVGLLNTAVDFTIYISLTRSSDFWLKWYLLANVIAFVAANVVSFVINKSWTFGNNGYQKYRQQYLRFLLVSFGALVIIELALFVGVDYFGAYDLAAKLVGIAISIWWSFLMHKRWTFK